MRDCLCLGIPADIIQEFYLKKPAGDRKGKGKAGSKDTRDNSERTTREVVVPQQQEETLIET